MYVDLSSISAGQSIACPFGMSLYIYICYIIFIIYALRVSIFITSPLKWRLVCCLLVYLQIFKRVSFGLHGCCGKWEGWARKPD